MGTVVGSAALTGNSATVAISSAPSIGQHSIQANWAGSAIFAPVNLIGTHTVTGLPTMLALGSSPSPSNAGDAVSFAFSLSTTVGSLPAGGTITLTDNGTSIYQQPLMAAVLPVAGQYVSTGLAAGSHTITVTYSGDSNYSASSTTITQVVKAIAATMTLTTAPNPALVGQGVNLSTSLVPASTCGMCVFFRQRRVLRCRRQPGVCECEGRWLGDV